MRIKAEIDLIDQEQKSLKAFSKAHKTLAENFQKIGTAKDAELAKQIFDDLGDIFEGAKKLKKKESTKDTKPADK
jgi:hypothetical protein